MPDIRACALTKHFSGVVAVRHVDFHVAGGEIVGYIVTFLIGATASARMQRLALLDPFGAVRPIALLTTIFIAVRIAAAHRLSPGPVDFNEAPPTAQRFDLHT